MMAVTYKELSKINVNEHTEKKGNLTYLSWAWAVDQLLSKDPTATWSYGEPVSFSDTLMVFCHVSAFGKTMAAQLPVMDYKNNAIINPNAMDVNTAMQRCLAKAIALHGIGLYIYAGEDLPEQEPVNVDNIVKKLNNTKSRDELTEVYKQVIKEVVKDAEAHAVVVEASRKMALSFEVKNID